MQTSTTFESGIEVVAPDLREQPLAADHLTLMLEQVVQDAELAIRQLGRHRTEASLAAREVEHERPRAHDVAVFALFRAAELHVDARDQLVEGERLAQIVGGAEAEAAQLRRQVRARRHDHNRELGSAFELVQHAEAVDPRQEQIEQDEVVGVALRALQTLAAVARSVDRKTLRFEPSCEEPEDPRLILDHQDPHSQTTITDDMDMTADDSSVIQTVFAAHSHMFRARDVREDHRPGLRGTRPARPR